MKKVSILLILFLFSICTAWATDDFIWTPVKVTTPENGLLYWERVEVYRDAHLGFVKEKILEISKYKNPQVKAVFPNSLYQGDTADSSLMALFYAPGWNTASKTPILLIPGAADDVFRGWVHPYTFENPDVIPQDREGFMQKFARAGYPVFAINFSHNHGCNYLQAEQIHNAIEVIKRKTRVQKVHILAHSKGNCSASIYLCGCKTVYPERFGFLSPFKRDVDIYVQIGPANKGIDLNFRYYAANITAIAQDASAPLCFYRGVVYGVWQDFFDRDTYEENPGVNIGNYFPGQNQLLHNLVDDGLDFSVYSYTPVDLNMTMHACYYGGNSMFVESYGIEHAIKEGGNTIERLNQRGLDVSVKLVNVYGTDPVLKEIDFVFFKIPVGVTDYPSDGAIYVHSAKHIDGLIANGARLLAQKGFNKNHVVLAAHQEVFEWVEKQLQLQ